MNRFDYYFINGWMLRDVFQYQKENANMTQWLSKRLFVTAKKNSKEENITSLLSVQLEQLNDVEFSRYWNTLEVVFKEQVNDLSLDEVIAINTKVGQYLDTQTDSSVIANYTGIPDVFLPIVPTEDIYVQRYACNRFFMENGSN